MRIDKVEDVIMYRKFSIKCGFTLAEVLITLGIIGIVAAMTLPALIQNYKKHEVETRLKKFYTTMNQAILMAKNDYGDYREWDFWLDNSFDKDGNLINKSDKVKANIEKYFKPYLNIVEVKETFDKEGNRENYLYYFSDGTAFKFGSYSTNDIFYYTNSPEQCEASQDNIGRCQFVFQFRPLFCTADWQKSCKKGIEPYMMSWRNNDVNFLYTNSKHGCSKEGNKNYCTAVIQMNGWKIPKNYPVKF